MDLGHWLDLHLRSDNYSLVKDDILPVVATEYIQPILVTSVGMKTEPLIYLPPSITYVCYLRLNFPNAIT